jgi:hypothetical protein
MINEYYIGKDVGEVLWFNLGYYPCIYMQELIKIAEKLRVDDIHVETRTKRHPNTSRKKWDRKALGSNAAAREQYHTSGNGSPSAE